MDISEKMSEIAKKLKNIKNYDSDVFVLSLENTINCLEHFYNVIAKSSKNKKEASEIRFDLPRNNCPKVGQIAYFNLGRAYPKELEDGHWCYILKDCGSHFVVIPTSSIKTEEYAVKDSEIKIMIKDFKEGGDSRLRVEHIRAVDKMRFYKKKKIYDVITDQAYIVKSTMNILFENIDNVEFLAV